MCSLYVFEMSHEKARSSASHHVRSEVDNILAIIKTVYKNCAHEFHEYYLSKFNSSLALVYLHDKHVMDYDQRVLTKFIDDCMMFRLKITITKPLKSDIMYQLANNVNPNLFTESLDSILEELIYSAVPSKLVDRLKQQLEMYNLDQNVLGLVLSKLDHTTV